jgi:hypothetical protein
VEEEGGRADSATIGGCPSSVRLPPPSVSDDDEMVEVDDCLTTFDDDDDATVITNLAATCLREDKAGCLAIGFMIGLSVEPIRDRTADL